MTKDEIIEVEANTMRLNANIEVGKETNDDYFIFDGEIDVEVLVDDQSFDHEFGTKYEYSYEITNIQKIVDEIIEEGVFEGEFTDEQKKLISDIIYSEIESGNVELFDEEWSLTMYFDIQ